MIGLPSLQAMDRAQGGRIWIASEATDMRCGFDRLAERVRAIIGENPQSSHLFVFCSRRGDRLKIWSGSETRSSTFRDTLNTSSTYGRSMRARVVSTRERIRRSR